MRFLWVCANCLRASCWAGVFFCDDARSAKLLVISRDQAVALGREHTDYIDNQAITARKQDYLEHGIAPARFEAELKGK